MKDEEILGMYKEGSSPDFITDKYYVLENERAKLVGYKGITQAEAREYVYSILIEEWNRRIF